MDNISDLAINFVKSFASNIMIVLLVFSLAVPKYRLSVCFGLSSLACLMAAAVNVVFFDCDSRAVLICSVAFCLVSALLLGKLLVKDGFMQWCFNIITALNLLCIVRPWAYVLSTLAPFSQYTIIAYRVLFMGLLSLLFYFKLRPIYTKVKENWVRYLPVSLSILIFYVYIMLYFNDLAHYKHLYRLISVVTACLYISVFLSLKAILEKYELREENIRIKTGKDLMRISADAMEQRLVLMENADRETRIQRHDRRHFDAVLLELLKSGKTAEAATLLEKNAAALPERPKYYCENPAVNAVTGYYITRAEEKGVFCTVRLDIPKKPALGSLELSMAVANLLENAIHGCEHLPKGKRWISFMAVCENNILVEIKNSCDSKVSLSEEGYPQNSEKTIGTGTKSVLAFVEKYDGSAVYYIKDGEFCVRLLL